MYMKKVLIPLFTVLMVLTLASCEPAEQITYDNSLRLASISEDVVKILARDVFATLPSSKPKFNKTIRRISRELSGVRIGLALGSGGAVGLAHIGVLKELEKEKIPVDIISGCSIGAIISALWASGISAYEIEKIISSFDSKLRTLFLVDPT